MADQLLTSYPELALTHVLGHTSGNVVGRAAVSSLGGGGSPGGSTLQLQYNNGGAFAGLAGSSVSGGTLSLNGGTITANAPILNLVQEWNNATTGFKGIALNITNTASQWDSMLLDMKVGGASMLAVSPSGQIFATSISGPATGALGGAPEGKLEFVFGGLSLNTQNNTMAIYTYGAGTTPKQWLLRSDNLWMWSADNAGAVGEVALSRPTTATIAITHNTKTSPTAFQVYNTTDSAIAPPTNYERGVFDWTTTANTLTIGAQKGGTGTGRDIKFVAASTLHANNWLGYGGSAGGFKLNYEVGYESLSQIILHDNVREVFLISPNTKAFNFLGDWLITFSANTSSGVCWSNIDAGLGRAAAGVLEINNGTAGTFRDLKLRSVYATTKAGAPVAADVPAGTFMVIRDTSGSTTKLYYNNGGTLQSVALA